MASKYFLHRISHESNVSYSLMKKGILTLGWSKFSKTDILNAAREDGYPNFDVITKELGENHNRSRWNIWYFAQMNEGDKVVVPLYGGLFSAFEVEEKAKNIGELKSEVSFVEGMWNKHTIRWNDEKLLFDENEKYIVDLGFYLKVKPIVENVPRNFVSGVFSSRMKIRTTNADITDIAEYVDDGIKAGNDNKPITLYGDVIDSLVVNMKESILSALNPDKFEMLIRWYLKKCGASSTWIPAKNETRKSDGADADIIAEFDNLKHIIYVQAKWHKEETSEWAVNQIDSYRNQVSDGDYSYSYATWVISSADCFSEKAKAEAEEKGVRLIDGKEFARMLIDIGLMDINDAFGF
ncbi:restriction endonuclease [Eubacterium sp.]|uniref:restriction endonuclease n=1 Tax=Eubacterium sp. TaxID=142586 RepID=UPI0025F96909|nr:restriction endonuclease [Eubacterium sp.]MCR5629084.1 restriction endonuclease [Eubacterium sp.]